MKTVLLSHFYNEEYLLPFWLNHHKNMFDEGLLIDYNSTDRSVEIIKKIVPHWKIVKTKNIYFDDLKINEEVQEYESQFDNYWKMCLNTTEFLVVDHLKNFLMSKPYAKAIKTRGVHIIDLPSELNKPIKNNIPLLAQRHHGFIEKQKDIIRSRIIHRKTHGNYKSGRHGTFWNTKYFPKQIFTVWMGWSPFNEETKKRKMQVQKNMPPKSNSTQGIEHRIQSEEQLEGMYRNYLLNGTNNLLNVKIYENALKACLARIIKI